MDYINGIIGGHPLESMAQAGKPSICFDDFPLKIVFYRGLSIAMSDHQKWYIMGIGNTTPK